MIRPNAAPAGRPWYSPVRLGRRLAIYLVVGYLTLCAFLYVRQNALEYPRSLVGAVLSLDGAINQARAVGLIPWTRGVTSSPPVGYVPLDFEKAAPRGTIVVFHGNGAWAAQRTVYVDAFRRRGFRTFLFEYPGYGGRAGRPSEKDIVPEARQLVRALEREGFGPIYLWGESLGSGVAAAVCKERTLPIHGLVLQTPWDTVANVGYAEYPFIPVGWLMIDRYDSVENLRHFGHPTCIIRGTTDEIIPAALTLHLFANLPPPKKIIVREGYGHGDWPSAPELTWWDEALDFVAPK